MITTYEQYEAYHAAKTALEKLKLLIIETNPAKLSVEFEDGSTKDISIHEIDDYTSVKNCTIYDNTTASIPTLKNLHSYMNHIPIEVFKERLKVIFSNHTPPIEKLTKDEFNYLLTGN